MNTWTSSMKVTVALLWLAAIAAWIVAGQKISMIDDPVAKSVWALAAAVVCHAILTRSR